jgi:RNA polymerase sigma-70 factor (ECF subfamily)
MGDLQAAVAHAMDEGRGLWPDVALAPGTLDTYVRQRAIPEATVRARAGDLFLAAACDAGDSAALVAFERKYLVSLRSYVARLSLSDEMLDDLGQILRIKLLVERPPRIGTYRGAGPLGAWVRVAAMRAAFDALGASAAERVARVDRDVLAARLAERAMPESELTRARGRPLLESAVEEAIAALSDRDKALLRFHYIDGLSLEALASMQRVHRATVARWLAEVRAGLLRAVEAHMTVRLPMTSSEFRSLVGAVQEELQLSIARILGG